MFLRLDELWEPHWNVRRKELELNHHENMGTVNALVDVSTLLTNAPYPLNLERTHHTHDNKAPKGIVLYNGLNKDR